MNIERRLLRLLSGELSDSEAQALRARLAADPALAARFERLSRSWSDLELPGPAAAPLGFAARVLTRAREPQEELRWAVAPLWVRTAAGAALVIGMLLGAGLSLRTGGDSGSPTAGMYESYLSMVSDPGAANESASPARP